jgi:sulfur carrier protein
MGLSIIVNGQEKVLANLASPTTLADVIRELALKDDRIAVEHNGNIAQRQNWGAVIIATGDRLEVVHFVGGGI